MPEDNRIDRVGEKFGSHTCVNGINNIDLNTFSIREMKGYILNGLVDGFALKLEDNTVLNWS